MPFSIQESVMARLLAPAIDLRTFTIRSDHGNSVISSEKCLSPLLCVFVRESQK